MTIDVRHQTDDDDAAVRAVITAAFDDDGVGAELAAALRARPDAQASLVAVEDERVVGHVHLSVSWVDAPTRLVEVLTVSPLTVAPSHHSQGIGGRLLAEAICVAKAVSPMLFLEGDPAYYSRHGWQPAVELGFVAPSTRIPRGAFQVVTLPSYDPAVMHGALVYNDTFWAHDCVGLRG